MRAIVPLLLCLVCGPALAEDPAPPPVPAVVQLRTTLPRLPTPTCTGPLQQLRPGDPCAVAFRLGTTGALIGLDHLLPVERRLIPISGLGQAPRRDAPPGTWATGFSADPQFVGLGSFDMRSRP